MVSLKVALDIYLLKFKIRFINVWFSAMIPAKKSVRQEIMQLISKSIEYQDSSFPLSVNFHA